MYLLRPTRLICTPDSARTKQLIQEKWLRHAFVADKISLAEGKFPCRHPVSLQDRMLERRTFL